MPADPTRLLAVDDELPMLEVVCDTLVRLPDVEVVGAESVADALRRLELEPFSLLVTDLRMPTPGGLILIERARALDPGLPVVAITGYPSAESARRCRELGISAYVRKPFAPETLLAAVVAALAGGDQAERTT